MRGIRRVLDFYSANVFSRFVYLCACIAITSSSEYGVPIEIKIWDTGRTPLAHMVDVTNMFGLKVLAEHNFLNDNNIAFSPYGLMGIMVALYEGVDGESSYQIQRGMQLPWNRNVMRIGFRDIHRTLKTYFVPEEGFLAGLALNNENVTFNDQYKKILRFYGFDLENDQLPTLSPETNNTSNETSAATSTMSPASSGDSSTTSMTAENKPALQDATTSPNREETTTTINPNAETISTIDIREATSTAASLSSASNVESTSASTTVTEMETTASISVSETTTQATPSTTQVTTAPTETTTASPTAVTTTQATTTTTQLTTTTTPETTTTSAAPSTSMPTATNSQMTSTLTNEPSTNNEVDTSSVDTSTPQMTTSQDATSSMAQSTLADASPSTTPPTTADSSTVTSSVTDETSDSTTTTQQTDQMSTITMDDMSISTASNTISTTVNDSTLETLERKKKSIVDFIFTNPPYVDDYLYYRSFDIGSDVAKPNYDDTMFLANGLKSVQVTYMHYDTVLEHAYLPHLEASALRLPLDSDRYYLLVVLPARGGSPELGRLLSRMARESDLSDIYSVLRPRRVKGIVPSFIVKGHVTLTTDLQKLGIRDVFEPRQRDFTLMTKQAGVYVRSIEQAVSVAIRKYRPDDQKKHRYVTSRDPVVFSATYPFLYFVMDANIHVALMAGKMVDPLNSRIL
ncbi:uncharacterized protein LOC142980153 [Anticarsia gemmatalis]|uniref:uncharacterized protein LOC142980153 n=1 Tax=Anticarsia gemmatalis TaxID=129554 RepID=UPI003F75DE35